MIRSTPLALLGALGLASVLLSGPARATENACTFPGITVFTDPDGDQNTVYGSPKQDIEWLAISELAEDTSTLTFTMQVKDGSGTLPPNGEWKIYFTGANGTKYFADMETDAASGVSFTYGHIDGTTGADTGDGAADGGSHSPDGKIKIQLATSKIGNPAPGQKLTAIFGRTYVLVGVVVGGSGGGSLQRVDDEGGQAGAKEYTLVGNASCGTAPTGNACFVPGVTVLTDPTGDVDASGGAGASPWYDAQKLSIAQPFDAAGNYKISFILKMADLSTVPAGTLWPINFCAPMFPNCTDTYPFGTGITAANKYFTAQATTDPSLMINPANSIEFQLVKPNAANTNTTTVLAEAGSNLNPDGTITIVVKASDLGLTAPGIGTQQLRLFEVDINSTSSLLFDLDNMPDSSVGAGSFKPVANNSCAPSPHVNTFMANPTSGDTPLPVNFTASATVLSPGPGTANSIASYTFNFGDGSAALTQAGNTAMHTYTATCAQTFSASVSATDSRGLGSDNTKTANITVTPANQAPVPALAINPANPDTLDTVELNASATHDPNSCDVIVGYTFDFGDGSPTVTQPSSIATHTYAVGTYTASVVATDNQAPPLTSATPATKTFTVTPPTNHAPAAALKANVTQGPAPLTVNFDAGDSYDPDATRTGDTVVEYDFDYRDGTTETTLVPTVSHQFLQPGVYDVLLTVKDNHGLASASSAMLEIKALNTPPAPQLTATPGTISKGTSTLLDASATTDVNGDSIVEYTFDPGDGTTPVTQVSPLLNHVYVHGGSPDAPALYTASVVAKDSRGGVSGTPATFAVQVIDQAPTAVFSATTPTSGTAPLTVTLDGAGSTDPDANDGVESYVFDFGDGSDVVTRVGGTSVQHVYATAGAFTARLTVLDQDKVPSAEKTLLVTVSSVDRPPLARMTSDKTSGDPPLTVSFNASTSTDPDGDALVQYTFDFGDGSAPVSQPGATIEHKYMTAGRYVALVTVRDARGAQSSNSDAVTITATTPPAEVNANVTPGGSVSPAVLLGLTLLGGARRRRRSRASD